MKFLLFQFTRMSAGTTCFLKLTASRLKNMNDQTVQPIPGRIAPVLWILLFVFVLRVIGQLLVACGWNLGFLPPMKEWHSGIMPYPWLVVSQILIIILYVKICLDFSKRKGFFAMPRRQLGKWLLIFGSIYFAAMIFRYIFRMTFNPDARWFVGTIPIFLHWVLASFLLIVGFFHWKHSMR